MISGWCGDGQAIPFNPCPYPPSSELVLVVSRVMFHFPEVCGCEVPAVPKETPPELQAYLRRVLIDVQWSACLAHNWEIPSSVPRWIGDGWTVFLNLCFLTQQ